MVVWRLSRRHDSWILRMDNFYISGVCYDFNQATDSLFLTRGKHFSFGHCPNLGVLDSIDVTMASEIVNSITVEDV